MTTLNSLTFPFTLARPDVTRSARTSLASTTSRNIKPYLALQGIVCYAVICHPYSISPLTIHQLTTHHLTSIQQPCPGSPGSSTETSLTFPNHPYHPTHTHPYIANSPHKSQRPIILYREIKKFVSVCENLCYPLSAIRYPLYASRLMLHEIRNCPT